jgi:hypothetical protein
MGEADVDLRSGHDVHLPEDIGRVSEEVSLSPNLEGG